MSRRVLFSVILILLAFSATVLPAVQAKPLAKDKRLQAMLENGFRKYLRDLGLKESQLDEEAANALFQQFLADNPHYNDLVREYQVITGQYDASEENVDVPFDELKEAEVVGTISFWNETVDGVEYAVKLTEMKTSNGATVYKATYHSKDGLVQDPYIYVKKSYLYVWIFWWKIQTGEFTQCYYKFMKNAGDINEAARLIYKTKKNLYDWGMIIGVLLAALAPFTYGLTSIPGIIYAWQANMIINELDAAYQNTANYIKLVWRVSWNYAGVGSWFDLHTIWADGNWHMMGLPNIDMGLYARTITSAFNNLGDKYGWNRWVWVGTYHA